MTPAKELELLLRTEIPIAAELGIRISNLSDAELILELPLKPNTNHKGTLFGGSLYSAGALSCYGLFLTGLRSQSFHTNNIVISEGSMKYLLPVDDDAKVVARWPSLAGKDSFFKTLAQKNKARIQITAEISTNGKPCAQFQGHFVAFL